MSTPAPGVDEAASSERRRSLGKYVKRMSSVFRRNSASASRAAAEGTTAAGTLTADPATESAPMGSAAPETSTPAATTTEAMPAPAAPTTTTSSYQYNRSAVQQERARALFAKYGLTLESHEWITPAPSTVQRVEKPIRMRVHRTCHRCETTFGADRVCVQCSHKRCKKCPRYPKKKAVGDAKEDVAEAKPKKKQQLTIKTKNGRELSYTPVKQRVRRNCHKCDAFFIPPTATVCDKCSHVRCTRCPRDPPKLKKWPNGYPGDAPASDSEVEMDESKPRKIFRKTRLRIRWECDQCHTYFVDHSTKCEGCGHERCESCVRKPPKKIKAEQHFDPEVVKRVEEKIAQFNMGESSDMMSS